MKKATHDLSFTLEAQAILSFIGKTWTPCEDLSGVIEAVRKAACHDARAFFQSMRIREHRITLSDKRQTALKLGLPPGQDKIAGQYDSLWMYLFQLMCNVHCMESAARNIDGAWDMYTRATAVHESLTKEIPSLASIRPVGLDEFAERCGDDEDKFFQEAQAFDVTPAEHQFEGVAFEGVCSFPRMVSLTRVMFAEFEDGYSPSESLVVAIYAHFVRCQEFLNTDALLAALDALPVDTPALIVGSPIFSDNPHLKVFSTTVAPPATQADFETALEENADFLQLSEAEREAILEERANKTMELIKQEIRKPDAGPSAQSKKTTACLVESMRSTFSA